MNKRIKAILVLTVFSVTTIFSTPYITNVKAATLDKAQNIKKDFKLILTRKVNSVGATAYEYVHKKTGAKILFLKNNDKNKCCTISFKTPAKDNKGTNHIIEHSVLCGSKKYPVKDAFYEMRKRSLATFINAMTASDCTMFPVGSKNDKGFMNLVKVYFDAVFDPNLLREQNIFKQEGWHYELNSAESELKVNGTVYNEMNGHVNDSSRIMDEDIMKSLLPDTQYKWISGGNPNDISTLSYKEFVNTYKKNYSASNSYTTFYGNVNINDMLNYMDTNYLSKCTKQSLPVCKEIEKPFKNKRVMEDYYGIGNKDTEKGKTYISLNYRLNTMLDKETNVAFEFLSDFLTSSEASPLKKAFKENGINDAEIYMSENTYQPILSILVSNTDTSQRAKIENIVKSTFKNVVKNGLNKEAVVQYLNTYNLQTKESSYESDAVGFDYAYKINQSWLYGGDPMMYLDKSDVMKKIKQKCNDGYLEKLISKYALNNKNESIVIVKPKKGLLQKNEKQLKEKFQKYKKSLSKKAINKLVADTKALAKWKSKPDSKKNLAKMPSLSINDLDTNFDEIPTKGENVGSTKVLYHNIPTDGVGYTKFYFDFSRLPRDKYIYLSFLTTLLSKMDTTNTDYTTIMKKIQQCTDGHIDFFPNIESDYKDRNKHIFDLQSGFVTLDDNVGQAFDLYNDIVNKMSFSNKSRVKEIVEEKIKKLKQDLEENTSFLGEKELTKNLDSGRNLSYEFSKLKLYKFLVDLDNNFDSKWDSVEKELEYVKDVVFNKNNLEVSFTGDGTTYKTFKNSLEKFAEGLSSKEYPDIDHNTVEYEKTQAIVSQDKIVSVMQCGNFKEAACTYNPKMEVLAKILNSYLFDKVRVQGGAYGTSFNVNNSGMVFESTDDPNMEKTFKAFNDSVSYIANLKANKEEMKNYIIGAVGNNASYFESPSDQAYLADKMSMTNETAQDETNKYKEMLNTTASDIRGYAKVLKAILDEKYYVVTGNGDIINQKPELFSSIKTIEDLLK
ncbi:insulinase family protein [Clostridium oryzae]|uniref:Peptidase M16C associated n=1 Tax=Clostridium oryzae TaxID=1450648 RepID=A0A1V4IMQ8_9CLOT|nr:insulinase family protein [Clostridium oryzae]OPJ61322.1 peptidase M16C associated [Clostridium oryzae]